MSSARNPRPDTVRVSVLPDVVRELYPAAPTPGSPDLLRLVAQASEHVRRLLGSGVSIISCSTIPGIERLEINRGDSLIGAVTLDLSQDFVIHLHSLHTTPEPGGRESRDYQAGTALMAAAISVFLSSDRPILYWTIDPRATGFYAKFFERYSPLLQWLGVSATLTVGKCVKGRKENDRIILIRHDIPMPELSLPRS